MKIGTSEFIVIFLVIFFVLGPEKTILAARKLGKLLRTLKVYITSLTGDLRETVVEPLQEIQEPLKDITAPLNDLTNVVQQPINEFNAAVRDLEKPVTPATPAVQKADETKAEDLEFAELEMAEPETEAVPEEAEPEPEAHVDADKEDAGDVSPQSDENSQAPKTAATASDFKT